MNSLRILQVSDSHLFQTDSGKLCGINTKESLLSVLESARARQWPPDLVLATGDLCQDESQKSYSRFRAIFEKLKVPVYCLPGNHDVPSMMRKAFNRNLVRYRRNFTRDGWQLILLDSRIPQSTKGHLALSELDHLKKCLKQYPRHHALVALHHQPVPVGSQWMDTMRVNNGEEIFKILKTHAAAKLVLFGHIHQEFSADVDGTPVLGCPSTGIQFAPGSPGFALDSRAPGYRWVELFEDGRFTTSVERLTNFLQKPDLSSKGY